MKIHFPYMICGEDHPTSQCPQKDGVHRFLAQNFPPKQPFVLTHPPPPPQNMVATNPASPQGGMEGTPLQEGSSSNASIFMCDQMVNLQTREKKYDIF